jgi:hypothetical protein
MPLSLGALSRGQAVLTAFAAAVAAEALVGETYCCRRTARASSLGMMTL